MPHDHQRQLGPLQLRRDSVCARSDLGQDRGRVAQVSVGVGQVSCTAHAEDLRLLVVDALEDAGVEQRGLGPRVDSHQEDEVSILDHFDLGVEEEVGSEVVGQVETAGLPEVIVEAVEGIEEILHGLDVLHTLELPNPAADLTPSHVIDPSCDHRHHIFPTLLGEVCSLAQKWYSQTLSLESVEGLPRFISQPLLVDGLIDSGIDSHDGVVLVVDGHVAAEGVHEVDGVLGQEFVGSGGVGEGAVVEGTDWADVSQIATQLGEQQFLDVGVDFRASASSSETEVVGTGYFLTKTDATGAMDAAVHVGHHERANVLVLHCPLELIVTAVLVAVEVGVVLQVTFSSLIADGAVQGVVGQQELHDSSSGSTGILRGSADFHGRGYLGAAGGDWLGGLLDLDEAHPAVACHFEAFVVAEAGDFDVVLLGRLEDGQVVLDLVGLVVDENLDLLGGEGGQGGVWPEEGLQALGSQQHVLQQCKYILIQRRQVNRAGDR